LLPLHLPSPELTLIIPGSSRVISLGRALSPAVYASVDGVGSDDAVAILLSLSVLFMSDPPE